MLVNYDPFDAVRGLDRRTGQWGDVGTGMPMDVYRHGDHVVVDLDMPGVDPGSIDVSVEGRTVSVQAERRAPSEAGEWLVAERPRGRSARRLTVGRDLDVDHLHATYVDGVLTLTIPASETATPRRVTIEHGDSAAGLPQAR